MKHQLKLLFFMVTVICISSCRNNSESEKNSKSYKTSESLQKTKALVKTYEGTGIVLSITPNKKQIIIKHDVIPGFMDAMTMPFNVPDSLMLEGIFPKDSVRIFIDYDGTNVLLKDIGKGY